MKKIVLMNFLLVVMSVCAYAQTTVKGKVTDSQGNSLPGVNVLVKGTSTGTVTDIDGNYSISADNDATLLFSFIGYVTEEVSVGSRTVIDISLTEDVTSLQEVVVVGYGTSTKKELTGATVQVKGENIEKMNMVRVDQALQGQLAGVTISTNSGAPGGTANIRIRGLSTFGDNDPLILVDGIVYDSEGLNALNPGDIESVNVLKDGTAGIYGVRAANGVILITTKKGKRNSKPSLTFDAYYGVQETTKKLNLLNATEYAILKNEAFVAGEQAPPFSNVAQGEGTDWQDEVFEEAPIQNYSLNLSGGSENTSYSIGGSYFKQEGIVGGPKASFERVNARINFITEIAPKVKLTSVNLYTNELSSTVPQGGIGSVLYNAINAYPTEPVRTDGRFSYLQLVDDIINPLAQLENTHNENRVNKLTGKQEISYTINDNFEVTGRGSYNLALVDTKVFNPLTWYGPGKFANTAANEDLDPIILTIGGVEYERGASVFESRNTFIDYTLEGFVNYNNTFADVHNVKGTLGASYFERRGEGLNGTGYNPINNSLDFNDIAASQEIGSVTLNQAGSFQERERLVSFFARAEYNYDRRYFISAIVRRDGSSKFGPNNRFGYFPSVSGAWIISEEQFFDFAPISFAKLRASYGVSGNDQIDNFAYRALLGGEATYVFNDALQNGAAIGKAGNPDLKWETTEQINIGLDLTVLDAIDFTVNYFIKNTSDLLFTPEVTALLGTYGAGGAPPTVNAGNVRNTGWEFELGYNTQLSNGIGINVGYNATILDNEVTETPQGVDFLNGVQFGVGGNVATRFEAGFPIGYMIGLETDGVWQSQEEIDASGIIYTGLVEPIKPGDLRFVDQNGDGQINLGDNSDRILIGSPIPDVTMGFNFTIDFKGVDLSGNLYAALGQEILRNYERQSLRGNQLAYVKERWTGPGSTNEHPRLTVGESPNLALSDYFIEDGSFVRMRNLQLGYTLPSKITEKAKISSLRFYIGANNLFTLTEYQGYDPDLGSSSPLGSGVDFGRYPQARTYMAGVNLKF